MADWFDELDLHAGPPEAAMGTRSLADERWLLVDGDWPVQREEARRLLRERRADVLAPGAHDAATELGDRIDRWLAAHRPDLVDDAHRAEPDPLAAAAMRVAEDLCLLTPGPDGWVLAAGCVCFPSYWRLA
ncbi:MAG TPA: heme-dependent oxidative N-demethylase subunit alpha family protein, partial [Acidimicrobiales bacterium]|nr:heme-dependent oxidative N-demethylase subunit alpha family protein [Acidimicrobiales bacterium]